METVETFRPDPNRALMKSKLVETLHELQDEAKLVNIDSFARLFGWAHNSAAALIWSLILFASIGITLFLALGSVQQYNAHRVSSTIRYHMENDPFPFPKMSLCSFNPFNSEFFQNLLELANVTMGPDEEADMDKYWRMFMEIESYLISTRGYPMTLEEKYQLTVYVNNSFDTSISVGLIGDVHFPTHKQIFHLKYFNCLVYNIDGSAKVTQIYDYFLFDMYVSLRLPMFASRFQGYYFFFRIRVIFCSAKIGAPLF